MYWNPWHGCHKCSEGCLNCYVYKQDLQYDRDASIVTKSKTNFFLPIKKDRNGNFKIPSGEEVGTCFSSDFFLEEADLWRDEVWQMIKQRRDLTFFIVTKRISRFINCIPDDWGDGYDNVIIAVTAENQKRADERLPIFLSIPCKHKHVLVSPILEKVSLEKYLKQGQIESVSVGGESYQEARVCDFEWIKDLKKQCDKFNVHFHFHQTGANFLYEGKLYKIKRMYEHSQAKKAMEILKNI